MYTQKNQAKIFTWRYTNVVNLLLLIATSHVILKHKLRFRVLYEANLHKTFYYFRYFLVSDLL